MLDRAPVILPATANLFFGCTGVVGWRDEGQCALDLDHDDVLDGAGDTALPKEREDFVEERAVAEDAADALEPIPLAEKGIDDVDLDRGIVPEVRDGTGRADIGEDEMIVIPYRSRTLGGKVRRSVWADGRNEAKSLTLDHSLHLRVEHAHARSSWFSRVPSSDRAMRGSRPRVRAAGRLLPRGSAPSPS